MIRRRFVTFMAGLALAGSMLVPAVSAAPSYSPDDQELVFLDLINAYRSENGLGTLELHDELGAAADYHSYDMAVNGYFDHTLADGSGPGDNIAAFGYDGGTWGENIAAGMETASEAMVSWQNSPSHNAAMLDANYTEIGIGRHYEEGSEYGWYWTTTFGGGEDGLGADDGAGIVTGDGTDTATVNTPATVNGVPVDGGVNGDGDGEVVTTVNGVPIDGGEIVNADGEIITVVYENDGAAPIETETVVTEEPSVVEGQQPAEPVYEEAAQPAGDVYVEETTITEDPGYVEATQPTERGVQEAGQQVYEAPTVNGVPVEGTVYDASGGYDDGSGNRRTANGDGRDVTLGDINAGSGTYTVDASGSYDDGYVPAPVYSPAPSAPAPNTTTTVDSSGTVTTTTTVNGISMDDGNATTYGNPRGGGASADPGSFTTGN